MPTTSWTKGLVIAVALVACASPAAASSPVDFSAGSWIIPMDACFQPSKSFNGSSFSSASTSSTVYGSSCPDTSGTARDGILKAYGLVYRLLQNGIPVYYILNTNKSAVDDVDLTIATTTTPVALANHTTGATTEFMNAAHTSITYRGAPFIISAADVPAALALLQLNTNFTKTDTRTGRGIFQDVFIHQAKTNILQAPVRAILLQTPPKIALLDINGASIDVLNGYLLDSGLYNSTAVLSYPLIGDVFTQFNQVSDFTLLNGLVTGGFSILWAPHWNANVGISSSDRDAITQKITQFIDAGHSFLAQCAAVAAFEGSDDQSGSGYNISGDANGYLITTGTGTGASLKTNKLPQPTFPAASNQSIIVNPDTTIQAWLDPLTQTGDFPLTVNNVTSYLFDFQPDTGYAFKPFVKTYVQSATSSSSTNALPIETVAYKDGNQSKGLVIYLGGHSYGSDTSSGCSSGMCVPGTQYNMLGLERLVLNSLIFLGQVPTATEQTRSSPVVTGDGKTYLGSYVQNIVPSSLFPPWIGHFREYAAGALAGTNVTKFGSVTADWDAYDHVKIQSNNDSRNIFTAVYIGGKLVQKTFTTVNNLLIGISSAVIGAIRLGNLGGIDHSIPAIIGPSTIAGSPTRPTVAYFGALDGMVHCIQVSGTGTGFNNGDEIWAFIPPTQLLRVALQLGGVDGSPSVGDAFIDPTGSGKKSWRTLLAIPDGNYVSGTLDVLDITDPLNPQFLWEAADINILSFKSYQLGRAQGAAIAPIATSSGTKFAYFVATDNTLGTAGNGFNMYALDASNGSIIWRFNHTYANDVIHNDVPGTVVALDTTGGAGAATAVFFGDLEGKVWKIPAATGPVGTPTPIFDAAAKYLPANSVNYPIESGVVLYRDPGTADLDVLGVTGGADWVPSSTASQVFRYDTKTAVASTLATLGTGERAYAVPTIFGNSAYLITSVGSLQGLIGTTFNASGNLLRLGLGATQSVTTLQTVTQGASEVAVSATGVVAASATGITQNANAGADTSQATIVLQNAAKKLMSVKAWFDFR